MHRKRDGEPRRVSRPRGWLAKLVDLHGQDVPVAEVRFNDASGHWILSKFSKPPATSE